MILITLQAALADQLDRDSAIGRLIARGFSTEEDVYKAASSVEEALDSGALATRGKLGESVDKVSDNI